jgi:hypothetical protein
MGIFLATLAFNPLLPVLIRTYLAGCKTAQ